MMVIKKNNEYKLCLSATPPEGYSEVSSLEWLENKINSNFDDNLTHLLLQAFKIANPSAYINYPFWRYDQDNSASASAAINAIGERIYVEIECRRRRYAKVLAAVYWICDSNVRLQLTGFFLQYLGPVIDAYINYNLLGMHNGEPITGILDFVYSTTGSAYESSGLALFGFTDSQKDIIANLLKYGLVEVL